MTPRSVETGPSVRAHSTETRTALVLGGGLAGLSAATLLAERGCRVTLVEGRGTLGGRTQSFRDRVTGDDVDTGQHALLGCYVEMFRLLERVGTSSLVRLQPALSITLARSGGGRAVLRCPRLPAPWHLAAGLLTHGALSPLEKLRCLRVIADARWRAGDPSLDAITVTEWLDGLGQSASARRHLWTPLALATLNASPDDAAASMLAAVIVRGLLGPGTSSSLGLPRVGLSDLAGNPALRYLEERGALVRLNQPVTRLVIEDGRCTGAVLREGEVAAADATVSTVPAPALHALLPEELRSISPFDQLQRFRPSPIVSLHAWLDRKVLDVPFLGFSDGDAHWAFDRDATWDAKARGGHLLTLVSSGADELAAAPREEVYRRLWQGLVDAVPAAASAVVLHWEVVKEKSATFRAVPGLLRHRFGPTTPIPGLLVAGDWTATGLPATMEGACLSGHAAAEMALAERER